MKVNTIHSFTLNRDGSATENKVSEPKDKADALRQKFGHLSIDVAMEVLNAIDHEDNVMYYEIKFWTEVKELLKSK